MNQLNILAEIAPFYGYAFQQNEYPLVSSLELTFESADETLGQEPLNSSESTSKSNLTIKLTSEPQVFDPEIWYIDSIEQGKTLLLQRKLLNISSEYLNNLYEQVNVTLKFELLENDEPLESKIYQTIFLPKNHWAGEHAMPELLAAFVTPNANYINELVRRASDVLKQNGEGSELNGYQSETRERPYLMAAAIWNVICGESIIYVNPPASFASTGQKVRLPQDIKNDGMAACLDLSLLFAACLENIGLNTVIALTKSHACCGFWLIEECFPLLTNDDAMDLRKRVVAKDLVLFETTLATSDSNITFGQTIEYADTLISENSETEFVYAIDIKQARRRQIRPLPLLEDSQEKLKRQTPEETSLVLPKAPSLPPVKILESKKPDTPETRIEQWQRKLLDLTRRNRLLNLSSNAVAVTLFCPQIDLLEDELASNETFSFTTPSDTPFSDDARDKDIFRFRSGNDPQVEYAKEQLQNKTLIANDSSKKLEKNLLSLFRKAKTDIEEGGSNTLFLAIGILKWKENPTDERTFRAPLILLPVELVRRSAKSKIRIKQRDGEEPIFNSTLVEFLQSDYEIDLSLFVSELPKDEKGIDVELIWSIVREKIKDVKGFEVAEELVLSTFSFAKYLMWRDLKDRVDDLKKNMFVDHLIEHPSKTYVQNVQFLDLNELDKTLKPSDVYAPLNADSSQLVAIDASAKSQDFVLEGPPGTGKSETIANMICHNLALGKKVLFVAEKMAALNVVYSRISKIKLDHLCLELHSNKANKRTILEQLKTAWTRREDASSTEWQKNADKLYEIRQNLNEYVNELHKETNIGITPRQAISRSVKYRDITKIDLGWPNTISLSVLKSKDDLKVLLDFAKELGLAFADVETLDLTDLSIINREDWSNAWQSEIIVMLESLRVKTQNTQKSTDEIKRLLSLPNEPDKLDTVEDIVALAVSLLSQTESVTKFVLIADAKNQVKNLRSLIDLQQKLLTAQNTTAMRFDLSQVESFDVSKWIEQFNVAQQKIWPLKWFATNKVAKKMKLQGIEGELSNDELGKLLEISKLCEKIAPLSTGFESDSIWQGWDTELPYLEKEYTRAKSLYDSSRKVASQLDSPSKLISLLKEQLVDNEEFYTNSKLVTACGNLTKHFSSLQSELENFNKVGGIFPIEMTLEEFISASTKVIELSPKLNAWCSWLSYKQDASEKGLNAVVDALESSQIDSSEVAHQVENAVANWLAPILIDDSKVLRSFRTSKHEDLIQEFRDLDSMVAITTSEYIASKVAGSAPDPNSPQSPAEYGVLSREFNKKSNHKPIRQLISEMGENLLHLTPCFMMSPLSVAQFLPSDFNAFDLVIFDEASQITVWDSVGTIARGKNVIIVGDPKQMPPTNFFSRSSEDDGNDENDLESILDQALSARLTHHRLTGHYRSRHESLIAFSNSHYYENSLVTFPSAETKNSAVFMHKIDGLYAKGAGRTNIKEANAVADFILERISSETSRLSIGVVTLNSDQQRCIEDCLDERRRKNSDLEPYFQGTNDYEPIFVKNLESVQGDERDVIILSLCYGPTEPSAKTMSMNFGPLNKSGGERRLNVAITRATTEVHVFASFNSSMIDLSRTQALAVQHLKYYMEFAEKGPQALAEEAIAISGVDQFDSYFEESVAYALRNKGWKVQTQVGVSKFRIDMGIIHPNKPGNYMVGIECDGATYHGSPAARDRDRVRHIILENLGWTILRVWSTDYFIDPKSVIDKLDEQLNEILASVIEEDVILEPLIMEEPEKQSNATEVTAKKYFSEEYKPVLDGLAKEILTEKNGISLHELVSDIGWKHNFGRTTQKQIDHITLIIKPWAGIEIHKNNEITVWLDKDGITSLIEWRGTDAFGFPREWSSLAYPEKLGLVKQAITKSPSDPIDFMFNQFNMSRRTKSTTDKFQDWIDDYASHTEEV
jgi:very-short-patch-repair endonuclease